MAREAPEKIITSIIRVLRNPHLWALAVMVALLTITHYHEVFQKVWILERISFLLGGGLARQTFSRILFLIPVTYGAAALGTGGGLSILALAAAAMLPRVFLISAAPQEALFETGAVLLLGALVAFMLGVLQEEKQQRAELETMQRLLNLQIKRLSVLHAISGTITQSLELSEVLDTAIAKVGELMEVGATWLYLCDPEKRQLRLAVSSGFSEAVLPDTLKLGEGLDGAAAESRQPMMVENVPADPVLRSRLLWQDGLQSVLIVPLISKGKIVGTLGVGARVVHPFSSEEVDLLRAVGQQISMAVENSRLYEKERLVAEALRASEENYRELFESASDAIWVHDLNGFILAANRAMGRLTGYERGALIGSHVSLFLSPEGLTKVDRELHEKVLRGEIPETHEQELVKEDGSTVTVNIGTSLITKGGRPWAIQHIARDITEEKRIQDNLRFYVQQVSLAQEAERKRIARELHDETAQALVAVSRNLGDLASGNCQLSIKDIQEQVRSILRQVRQFGQQLRPSILDDLGLMPALNWLASDLTKNYNIAADVLVVGKPRQLPPEAELNLFRIAQEALTNVRRHAEANSVGITVEFGDDRAKLTVTDNGKGFKLPARVGDLARDGKLGLAGMQERAQLLGGTLTIDTEPGKGTILTVEVPL